MNYIRFWRAGESEKTSMRTRDYIRKIVSSGHFAGEVMGRLYTWQNGWTELWMPMHGEMFRKIKCELDKSIEQRIPQQDVEYDRKKQAAKKEDQGNPR